jgi:hypothetical protein
MLIKNQLKLIQKLQRWISVNNYAIKSISIQE